MAAERPKTLRYSDPAAMLIGGVFLAAAAAGLFSDVLGWDGDRAGAFEAGCLMIAGAIRWWLEGKHEAKVLQETEKREQQAFRRGLEQPPRLREGARGEGGPISLPNEPTPVTNPERVERKG